LGEDKGMRTVPPMTVGEHRRQSPSCVRHLGLHSARNHDKMPGGAMKSVSEDDESG
jgi:hypothetical protein